MKKKVIVNDRMQRGYVYWRTEPVGRNFAPGFTPDLTPNEMLKLGVFGGKYMTDCREEFPRSWFAGAKLCVERHDARLNYFRVKASQSLGVWRRSGWIHKQDPRGWLKAHLAARGLDVPIYLGMRNWHPLLSDTLKAMAQDGVRRAIGFVCAAHRSYSSCTQYRENVVSARQAVVDAGLSDVSVTYVGDWHDHPRFIEANARQARAALDRLDRLPPSLRSATTKGKRRRDSGARSFRHRPPGRQAGEYPGAR